MAIFSPSRKGYRPACKPYALEAEPEAAISAPAPWNATPIPLGWLIPLEAGCIFQRPRFFVEKRVVFLQKKICKYISICNGRGSGERGKRSSAGGGKPPSGIIREMRV